MADSIQQSNDVQHPSHYNHSGIECLAAIEAQLGRDGFIAFCHGNIAKYMWRWKFKGGKKDLEKARFYLDAMINAVASDSGA